MPIVVDPGFSWPPEVDPVVSPDGRITAIVDPAHAGVLLRADFDDSVPDTPAVPEVVYRKNLVKNPSFENGTGDWREVRCSLTTRPHSGVLDGLDAAGSREVVLTSTTTTSSSFADSTGTPVAPSQWVAVAGLAQSADGRARTGIAFYDGSTWKGESWSNAIDIAQRAVVVEKVPAGATSARAALRVQSSTNGNPTEGQSSVFDNIIMTVAESQAEALALVETYFDGETAPSGHRRYRRLSDGTSEEYTPATPFIPGHGATTAKVRFERQDGTIVRSGNPAWAPGGYAHAYDHEATLGGGTLWRAVPIRFDGTEGEPSEYVGAVIPALTDGWAWLKPVTDPDAAMKLKVEPINQEYDGRLDTTSIAGAGTPAATWDVLEGFTGQLRALIREKTVQDKFMELLNLGPVLVQFPPCAGVPDFYCLREKVSIDEEFWDGYPVRRYTVPIVSVARPDTTDSPLRIPGLSYDTVERDWTTYDQLKSTVSSYNKLLEP